MWWGTDPEELKQIVLTIGRKMYDSTYQCSLPEFVKDDAGSLTAVTNRIEEFVGRMP